MKKNLWDYLASYLNPAYWLMLEDYSPRWDAKLQQLMEEHKFSSASGCTARLGDFCIWIANHPYSSFNPHGMPGIPEKVRASRSTIHYAMRRLRVDAYKGTPDDPYPEENHEVAELRRMMES